MTSNQTGLPNDIILHVFSFLYTTCKITCKENISISKMVNEKFFKNCLINQYVPIKSDPNIYGSNSLSHIRCCYFHSPKHMKELVNKLNGLKMNACLHEFPHYVRFSNERTCKLSMKYLLEYGVISHLVENNKCAVLMSCDELLSSFI